MIGTAVRVVLAALLATAALLLSVWAVFLIWAAITGSSDTALWFLVAFGVACAAGAIVAGSIVWMLSHSVYRFYRHRRA
jgi:hypothetical protein